MDRIPAVAAKVLVIAPAATVTVVGRLSALAVLESATAVPPGLAALVSVTVQVAFAPGPRVAGSQDSAATLGGVSRAMDVETELPFSVAVMVAV